MDALTLLGHVSNAYRSLKNLAIEATIITESGDENSNQRNEQLVRFFYATPDCIRYERGGKKGTVQVADGKQLHTSFSGHRGLGGGPRYSSVPLSLMPRLPHFFRSQFPLGGGDEAFLFQGIDEHVVAAQILREEEGCHVLSVTFEAPPYANLIVSGSAILFWVNAENYIVMRLEGEVGHRVPTEDEITWSRHIVTIQKMRLNEQLPEDTFHFTPPADATLEAGGQCGMGGGGGGFVQHSSDGQRRLEHHGSHKWDGDTLVEHSKWKIRGVSLTFERRLTFSADEKELHVAERIMGPKGEVESSCDLPVD
jgi:outer membrane lipoprotein-sorting protein